MLSFLDFIFPFRRNKRVRVSRQAASPGRERPDECDACHRLKSVTCVIRNPVCYSYFDFYDTAVNSLKFGENIVSRYLTEELLKSRHVGKFGQTIAYRDDRNDIDDIFGSGVFIVLNVTIVTFIANCQNSFSVTAV